MQRPQYVEQQNNVNMSLHKRLEAKDGATIVGDNIEDGVRYMHLCKVPHNGISICGGGLEPMKSKQTLEQKNAIRNEEGSEGL